MAEQVCAAQKEAECLKLNNAKVDKKGKVTEFTTDNGTHVKFETCAMKATLKDGTSAWVGDCAKGTHVASFASKDGDMCLL